MGEPWTTQDLLRVPIQHQVTEDDTRSPQGRFARCRCKVVRTGVLVSHRRLCWQWLRRRVRQRSAALGPRMAYPLGFAFLQAWLFLRARFASHAASLLIRACTAGCCRGEKK